MLTDHNKFEYFPTDAELEILQILWKNGSATVREVFEQLALRKDIKYTTALKLMQIMHEKGLNFKGLLENYTFTSHWYKMIK